ncbi:hypothetical protein Vadar_002319 [Vaccinium darrowii]|uniref:Uncharacterized protein n=1 Tax=Vaccinium darrowii TaxID=229202 RepID=A0ACB7YSK2_9ERIC|nr:hypothetical protein Vadar_002319 [Vaccinium darrowii]
MAMSFFKPNYTHHLSSTSILNSPFPKVYPTKSMSIRPSFSTRIPIHFRAKPVSSVPTKPFFSSSSKAFSSQISVSAAKPDEMPARVGFLGLGIMGSPMAQNLIKAGCDVTVWNRTESKCGPLISLGAKYKSSPKEVAASCDVTFAMLADPESALDVACGEHGAAKGMSPGKGYCFLVFSFMRSARKMSCPSTVGTLGTILRSVWKPLCAHESGISERDERGLNVKASLVQVSQPHEGLLVAGDVDKDQCESPGLKGIVSPSACVEWAFLQETSFGFVVFLKLSCARKIWVISLVIAFQCWVAIKNPASVDVARIIIGWDPHVLRYIDVSTVDGATSKLIGTQIKATGALFLEAPVSGSKKPAEDGQLIFLTAGDRSLFDTVAPLLDIMGKSRFFLGDVGNGAAMKLVVNMIMGSMMASFSEGLLLSEKVGLDPKVLVEVVSQGAISAPMFSMKGPSMVQSLYPTAFPLKHQQKDLRLALGLAESVSQPTPIAAAANELYKVAKSRGLSDEDFSAVIEALKAKLQNKPE